MCNLDLDFSISSEGMVVAMATTSLLIVLMGRDKNCLCSRSVLEIIERGIAVCKTLFSTTLSERIFISVSLRFTETSRDIGMLFICSSV